jgi:hypothetical protein
MKTGTAFSGRPGRPGKFARTTRGLFAFGLAIGLIVAGGWKTAEASNMAFKLNKQIFELATGGKGKNYIAFPDRGPHQGSGGLTNICTALNLGAGTGEIKQFDAAVGTVNSFLCGQLETWTFQDGVGVIVTSPTATSGIIVGADTPGNSFQFEDLGSPPIGYNLFPVEYHTTAVTPEDLCNQCGLSTTAQLLRFDAQNGTILTHQCTQLPLWNLVLGEAVLILEDNGPKNCTPPHF